MTRTIATTTLAGLLALAGAASAGPFNQGIGSAMIYGPYTGGHMYSYAEAYHYGYPFSAADTWRRHLYAYPQGVYPYRPYGKPIYYRVFPHREMISVPGPDGLPVLVPAPGSSAPAEVAAEVQGAPAAATAPVAQGTPALRPVPAGPTTMPVSATTSPTQAVVAPLERPAFVRLSVPADAEVWFEKEKMKQGGGVRIFQTPSLPVGRTMVYSVRARWKENGRDVEQFRVVGVRAGETAQLTFTSSRP